MNLHYREAHSCRICKTSPLSTYLDLGNTPLANNLLQMSKPEHEEVYPLCVSFCSTCSLSQLTIVVDPKKLFSHYVYRSSISTTFQKHCSSFAKKISSEIGHPDKLVVDIASNDGCLLTHFKQEGFRTLGVEPATNIATIAEKNGISTINSFWDAQSANEVLKHHNGADIITATNVFAHVDDLHSFLCNVNIALKENGQFIIEVPYLANLLKNNEFDTIYHEHLSYFLLKPLIELYSKHALRIFRVEEYPIHGGSIRVYSTKNSNKGLKTEKSVASFLDTEQKLNLHTEEGYRTFRNNVEKIKKDLVELLVSLKSKHKMVGAYGASAKGNTLLNYCGINSNLVEFIIDDTPEKQGRFSPGSRLPILSRFSLTEKKPDYLILLAWNFADEIISKTNDFKNNGGKYIIPIPQVRLTP